MPLPRELTTPPVTKMYFVELTGSPPLAGARVVPPPCSGLRPYPRPAPPADRTVPPRWECRAPAGAAARGAPRSLPEPAGAAPQAAARPPWRATRPPAGDTPP